MNVRSNPEAFAAEPTTIGNLAVSRPQTGAEYLESLNDGREVFIYGEKVKDVTKHPAFRNTRCMTTNTSTRSWCRPTPAMAA
jgi:4-hydroxyphenylacetate 3-monooxygenase